MRGGGGGRPAGPLLYLALGALLMPAIGSGLCQDAAAPQETPAPPSGEGAPGTAPAPETGSADAAPPPGAPGQETPPEALSSFLTRDYPVKTRKLWKALLETLRASGYPPEEVDEGAMTVKTSFVDFDQKDYSEQVAEPPPRLGPTYHIVQMIKVAAGKVSLEAAVAPKDKGSEIKIRARILVQGLDRRRRVRLLVDRRSAGVIEGEFLIKLQERLGVERS